MLSLCGSLVLLLSLVFIKLLRKYIFLSTSSKAQYPEKIAYLCSSLIVLHSNQHLGPQRSLTFLGWPTDKGLNVAQEHSADTTRTHRTIAIHDKPNSGAETVQTRRARVAYSSWFILTPHLYIYYDQLLLYSFQYLRILYQRCVVLWICCSPNSLV